MTESMTKELAEAYLRERGFKLVIDAVQISVPKRSYQFTPEESASIYFLIQHFSNEGIEVNFHYEKS